VGETTSPVGVSKHGNVALILVDNPPVNALSRSVRRGVVGHLEALAADDGVGAIVIAGRGRSFSAGADIAEFGRPPEPPTFPDMLRAVAASSKPVIAALHGTTLGGGLELALFCHYRVAAHDAMVGLPEVKIGLVPGAGGTQTLPRAAGLETALEIITSGKPVSAWSLEGTAVFDELIEGPLIDGAIAFAEKILAGACGVKRISDVVLNKRADHDELFASWRAKVAKKYRGQQAPLLAVDSIENAVLLPFEDGLARERELFVACRESVQSRAMRYAFFAEREAGKVSGPAADLPAQDIGRVGIVGAGTMGAGIAICFADAGIPVRLLELSEEQLQRGLETIAGNYRRNVEQGRMDDSRAQACTGRIEGSCDYGVLADCDLVIEAAFESMQVKRDIFARLDRACAPHAILATNTSFLDIDRIAAVTTRPEQVVGMHFFSPAHIMRLLEVVRAGRTSEQVLKSAMDLGRRLGKIPVAVGLCYGFVGNRMYACYGREAQMLLLDGASPARVDDAMTSFGMAMGPLAVADLTGLDIGYRARRENPNPSTDPSYFRPADALVEAGRLGQKTGVGFYSYPEGSRRGVPDERVHSLIRAEAERLGVVQREIGEAEIQDRLIMALVNEGAKILEEGIARRASDIDVIWLNGYGFPRYRGGPMHYADTLGLDAVLAKIESFMKLAGDRYWTPAPLLIRLREEGKSFTGGNG